MIEKLNTDAIGPLLAVAEQAADPQLCLAALDAASRFPLAEDAWQELARLLGRLLADQAPGSATRQAALILATRIPLLSVRRRLRDVARNDDDPDSAALAEALAQVGDPSQIEPLLDRAAAGDEEAFALLAAVPVEARLTDPALVPAPPANASDTTRYWHALVRARLGDFAPLDTILEGEGPEPELFWGSPWNAYDAIAAVRPVPEALRDHLLAMLARLQDTPQVRTVELIVWAATGIADAEGNALDVSAAVPSTAGAAAPGDAAQTARALSLAELLPQQLFEQGLSADEEALLAHLPADRVADLVTATVAEANRRVRVPRAGHAGAIITPGPADAAIGLIDRLPVAGQWPAATLAMQQITADQPALDDDQMAWVIAHDHSERVIQELTALVTPDRSAAEQLHILKLLGSAGDHQAGRGGSPWRGAGPGSAAPIIGRGSLIDDQVRELSRDVETELAGTDWEDQWAAEPERSAGSRQPEGERDARLVHAQILQNGQRRNTFLAGSDNVIRCWIGLPEPERAAVADDAIPTVHIPPEGLTLDVELCWGEQTDKKQLVLPADRTARTADCDLHIHVPEGECHVSALILFRYLGRAFEVVQVNAEAIGPDDPERPEHEVRVLVQASLREVIELPERTAYDTCVVSRRNVGESQDGQAPGATLWMFGGTAANRCDLRGTEAALAWLNDDLFITQKSLVRRRAAQGTGSGEDLLDAGDSDVRRLLRDMARHGSAIHKQLRSSICKDPGERIQLLNLEPDAYVPLEFVYDRGYPADDARLCDGWLEALRSDSPDCPVCSQENLTPRQLRWTPTICPLGFWSLQKIIERRDPAGAAGEPDSAHPSAPTPERRQLRAIDDILFASSHYVPAEEREVTWTALRQQFSAPSLADDWDQWLDALEARHRPLLVMLPHHDAEAGLDFLEIGDEGLPPAKGHLSRGQLDEYYINPARREPGPIVLLLGCRTAAQTEVGYVQLARRFQQLHSSIVVGTLAQVLGRHAAPVARELVAQLVAEEDADADFGRIMRRVRRRMLAKGYLMALCLVALGDAEWRLTPLHHTGSG